MRKLITNDVKSCVGCNRCIRVCPVEEANIAYMDEDGIKVRIDNEKCIACGACISACKHGSRDYEDDTESFFRALKSGEGISLFVAPANRTNFNEWGRILTWLRNLGVNKIYDVSLGADICTWAHIRYIQKYNPGPIITQPCPAIVNYVLMYKPELIKNLSPIHSPMMCTSVYMKTYENISDKLAVLSPCIAKSHEFEETGLASYNVTFKKLVNYIKENGIVLPDEVSSFDHIDSSIGSIYSMPGGLKENVEFYIGKSLRIDKAEGQHFVYKAIDEYSKQKNDNLPAIFDVLNCPEGCNLGTGCIHKKDIFEINTIMDTARSAATSNRKKKYFDKLFDHYDKLLNLNDFIREYTKKSVKQISISNADIENGFVSLGKTTELARNFDCGACGSESCAVMAKKIAKGLNTHLNCIEKSRGDIMREHSSLLEIQKENLDNINKMTSDITLIKELSDTINSGIKNVDLAMQKYSEMANEINKIAVQINIIALNASVEAARAGEAGKGFAVVADEIRTLSKHSSKTVSETEEVSNEATTTISSINTMMQDIENAVQKSYENIMEISENTGAHVN